MNLFDNILNKTKGGFNYLATGQFGSDIFDIQQQAQQKQANPIQSFLEESKTNPNMQNNRNAVIQMIQNGEDDSFIQDVIVNKIGYTPGLTLKERVGSAIGERFTKAGESLQTDKTGFEKSLSATKDIVSLPFDILGATAQPVIQPVMEQAMKIPGVAPTAQFVGEKYGEFRKENPRLAQNIEAIAGIGSVVAPFTKTGQAVIKAPGQLVRQGAEATMQGVRKVAPSVVKGAETTVDIAAAPFKSIYNTAKRYIATPEEISGIQAAIKPKQRVKNGVVQRSQKQIENEIKLTNALIRGRGEVPQGLDTYALSQKKLLEEMGSEIEKATGQPLFIDATQSAGKIRQLANSKAIQTLDPADTNALLALADRLEQNSGRMSIADAEAMNQYINDVIKSTSTTASEGYKKGLLILVQDLRDGLDNTISNIPGEFKSLKKAYGAVRNVYGDTIARQIVFNRQNLSGLVDSIGAIEGFGNIASGAGKIVTGNVKEGFVDIGKGMTQNAVGRFIKAKNDPDNIIRSIFRQGGERAKGPDIKPKPLPMLPPPSGKATGAKNFRVNQPKDTSKVITEKVNPEKVKRPNGNTNNTPSNSSGIPVRSKKVQKPSSEVTPKIVKPVEKTMKASEKINGLISKENAKDVFSEMGIDMKNILKREIDTKGKNYKYIFTTKNAKGEIVKIAEERKMIKEKTGIHSSDRLYGLEYKYSPGEIIGYRILDNKPLSPQKTSATQVRGPIDPTTGKRKTIVQSPTAYEAGIRRPYTLNGNKPIVKRASDSKGLPISKGDEALMSEARKYKSAEEFIKAQGEILYHGGGNIKEVGNMRSKWQAFYMTDNPTYAKSYGGPNSVLNEIIILPKAKIVDMLNLSDDFLAKLDKILFDSNKLSRWSVDTIIKGIKAGKAHFAEDPNVKVILKKMGYDGMITRESKFGLNYGVWNKNVLKTKDQLKQIYEQATKPKSIKGDEALMSEARKYNSAEEFEKALRSPRGIGYGGNMGILWRATSKPYKPDTKTIIEHGITDSGNTKSYSKDILLSNDYGKSEPYIISKDAKIASWSEGNDVYKITKESAFSKKSIEEFKRRGFDGFSRGPDEIVIFNHEKINPFNIKDFFTNYIK